MTAAILLAGGIGSRMGTKCPKQYLMLKGKPVASYAFETLRKSPAVDHVTVVCQQQWQGHFPLADAFANPGQRRQDSVKNGMFVTPPSFNLFVIHDAARPLLTEADLARAVEQGKRFGAAVLAGRAISTCKLAGPDGWVDKTLDRSSLWEAYTPQVLRRAILEEGFEISKGRDVTDDVSLAELAGFPVRLVEGTSSRIKITTPEDLAMAEALLNVKKCPTTN